MTEPELYAPGPANLARVEKDGEKWTLILVREDGKRDYSNAQRPGAAADL